MRYIVVTLPNRSYGLPLYFSKWVGSQRWTLEKEMAIKMSAEDAAALCLSETDNTDYRTFAEEAP